MTAIARAALIVAVLAFSPAAGAGRQEDETSSPKLRISWEAFRQAYDAGEVVVVDVRGRADYEAGHIPQARWLPLDGVAKSAPALRRLKKPIVTYCA